MSSGKVNFVLEDKVKEELNYIVPRGKRSQVVNEAIKKEILLLKRKKIAERLRQLRAQGPALSTQEILAVLNENRRRR
jgi:hypothetical protein